MAAEEKQEADRGDHASHAETGGFEFKVGPDDSAEQKERRERGDPLRDIFKTRGLEADDPRGVQPAKPGQSGQIGRDAACKQGLPTNLPRGLLRAEREERAFGIDDLAADFHFLVEVHEAVHQLGVVAIFLCHAPEVAGEIGNDFGVHRFWDFLPGTGHRGGGSDGADRSHENLFRRERDERPGRTGVRVHISVGRDRTLAEHLDDFLGGLEVAAGGVHIEDDRRRAGRFRVLHSTAQKEKLGLADHALHGQHHHRACGDFFLLRAGAERRHKERQYQNPSSHGAEISLAPRRPARYFPPRGIHLGGKHPARRGRQRHRRCGWILLPAQARRHELPRPLPVP